MFQCCIIPQCDWWGQVQVWVVRPKGHDKRNPLKRSFETRKTKVFLLSRNGAVLVHGLGLITQLSCSTRRNPWTKVALFLKLRKRPLFFYSNTSLKRDLASRDLQGLFNKARHGLESLPTNQWFCSQKTRHHIIALLLNKPQWLKCYHFAFKTLYCYCVMWLISSGNLITALHCIQHLIERLCILCK